MSNPGDPTDSGSIRKEIERLIADAARLREESDELARTAARLKELIDGNQKGG